MLNMSRKGREEIPRGRTWILTWGVSQRERLLQQQEIRRNSKAEIGDIFLLYFFPFFISVFQHLGLYFYQKHFTICIYWQVVYIGIHVWGLTNTFTLYANYDMYVDIC